jgi:hypothetical protein
MSLGASSPKVGQPITVVLRLDTVSKPQVMVIAVAPGRSWYDVVGVATGQSQIARADLRVTASASISRTSPAIAGGRT